MAGSEERSACTVCNRPIVWIHTAGGTVIACDPDITEFPKDATPFSILYSRFGEAMIYGGLFPGSDVMGYKPHFITCDDWLSKKDSVTTELWAGYASVSGLPPPEGGELP